nr:MAG TPA: hypothetical protein [Caudoviricetes sp.]
MPKSLVFAFSFLSRVISRLKIKPLKYPLIFSLMIV